MAFTVTPPAGAKLTASVLSNLITELRPIRATKTVATSRNTTIVRVADPDLSIALPANSTWDWYLILLLSSAANAAGDFSGEMAWMAGATDYYGSWGLVDTIASGRSADLVADGETRDGTSPSAAFEIGCTTVTTACLLHGSLEVGGTAGSLTLNWAQLASNGNNTTVNTGSTLTAHRVD